MLDIVLFAAFPYVALILALGMGLYRYFDDRFSFSSLSSQFLESRQLFLSSVPWHYGIILILLAHLLIALLPGAWAAYAASPTRLYAAEVAGLIFGFAAVAGAALFIVRRLSRPRLKVVTSALDWVLLADLLLQVALGVCIALVYRWGSVWALSTAVPWLWSLARVDPQVQYVAVLPWVVKLHFLNAFLLLALFPFTRLVHVVTLPISYLWRPRQLVVWYRLNGQR